MSSSIPNVAQRSFRINLVLIFAVFAIPLIAAYLSFYVWPPQGRLNYGELLEPKTLPDVTLRDAEGKEFPLSKLRGKWIMLSVDSADCGAACDQKLFLMRQTRISMTKEMNRVERVLLLRGDAKASAELVKKYPGMHILSGANESLLNNFPAAPNITDHIYLIDPVGQVMMRYIKDPDATGIRRDLMRLLSVSQVG
jgi:peroxiredoxin